MKFKNIHLSMIRVTFIFILIICSNLMHSQNKIPRNYLKIPDTLYFKDKIYKFIIPSTKYDSWKVILKEDISNEKLIYEYKRNNNIISNDNSLVESGFFWECAPNGCFNYIVAHYDDKFEYFTSDQRLRDFIGYVDNLSEALLIARTYGLLIDRKNPIGGSYRIEKKFIYLYMAKFKNCPVSSESFDVRINRETGKLESESKGIYYKTEDCYSS